MSDPQQREFIKGEMERQLKLVSHAMIRGQNLPAPEAHGFSISRRHLAALRLANMIGVGSTTGGATTQGGTSIFEVRFGNLDIASIIIDHLPVKDMKALAGVSKVCRTMVHLKITTWDLGKLDMGCCNELGLKDEECTPPRRIVWVHGRSEFDDKDAKSKLPDAYLFETDRQFMADTTASYNVIYSGVNLASGMPFQRIARGRDTRVETTTRMLATMCTMHENGTRLFTQVRDEDKKCVNYTKFIRIQSLLTGFAEHGQNIKSLYLDQIPFLSPNFLNVALENLPELQELHIENCELLHIGCLIPLLDTIHWIGARRGKKFIALDFFPKAWFGPHVGRNATCVVTYNPPDEHRVAMGVMVTIIIAAMKSTYMGFDIIQKGSLLEKFLQLIPMPFGLASLFLKHLRESIQLNLKPEHTRSLFDRARLKDLTGQILAATCLPNRDIITGFHPQLAHLLVSECKVCKHVVLTHMLHPRDWTGISGLRICMACSLSDTVLDDDHAWLADKREITRHVFNPIPDPPADWTPPQPFDLICPVIKNEFVRHPEPTLVPEPNVDDLHDPFGDDDSDDSDDESSDEDLATLFAQFDAAISAPSPAAAGAANVVHTGPTLDDIRRLNDNARQAFLVSIPHKIHVSRLALDEFRNIHRNTDRFWYDRGAFPLALFLDSKNRFAQSIGMHIDDTVLAIQPRRMYYLGRTTWEGIYRTNAAHQGRPITHDDRAEWAPPLLPTGMSATVV
ncbi:hypothetical protein F5X68DRAFT_273811 [Plectosphaerella plurivora]|uniref:F-box domain-containing protein n=1 Tax=Plectosphaerella plurivora TaxID=936078 RepID=A0A9P9AG26_9PEZI|nr:hypothetical protein F5X68DRAFT_273811 [Plectosphaerella plurivora]